MLVPPTPPEQIPLAIGEVDLNDQILHLSGGGQRSLTEQDCALLAFFSAHPNEDLSRAELLTEVLGYAPGVVSRAVDDAVKRLRARIERVPAQPFHLLSVRGVGYRFVPLKRIATPAPAAGVLKLSDREIDLDRQEVRSAEGTAPLTALEGRLLTVLAQRPGVPIALSDLEPMVWGSARVSPARLNKLVYRLRRKLEREPGSPTVLCTVRGRGMALNLVPDAEPAPGVPCRPPRGTVLGRRTEVDSLQALLGDGCPLITILGPAGAGKTTLARWVGAIFSGPTCFVDLSKATTTEALEEAVSVAMGLDGPDTIPAAISSWSGALMVLDNAEQIASVLAERLSQWLPRASGLRFVVTSRRPLHLEGEHLLNLSGLPMDAAVALYQRRASARGASAAPVEQIRKLVSALDFLPLAIELAASRAGFLGIDGVLSRLDRPLETLKSRQADVPARHRSIQAALSLSWELLDAGARELLASCAVFQGGFTVQAAEAVLGAGALDGLEALIEASLLRILPNSDHRIAPYVAVEQFTAAHHPPLSAALRRRHLVWAAHLGGEPLAGSTPLPEALPRLSAELENALAAMAHGATIGEHALVNRCLSWVVPLLLRRGENTRARSALARFAVRDEASDPAMRREIGYLWRWIGDGQNHLSREAEDWGVFAEQLSEEGAGELAGHAMGQRAARLIYQGRLEDGREALRRAREMAGAPVPDRLESWLLNSDASLAHAVGDMERAWELRMEALRRAQASDFVWRELSLKLTLGHNATALGSFAEAETWLESVITRLRSVGARLQYEHALNYLANLRFQQGRPAEAIELRRLLVSWHRQAGREQATFRNLGMLGQAECAAGDLDAARAHIHEALVLGAPLQEMRTMAWMRTWLAEVEWSAGNHDDARAHLSRALSFFSEGGMARYELQFQVHDVLMSLDTGAPELAGEGIARIGVLVSGLEDVPVWQALLRLLRAEAEDGEADLEGIPDLLRKQARPWQKVVGLCSLAIMARRSGELEQAGAFLAEACAQPEYLAVRAGTVRQTIARARRVVGPRLEVVERGA